MQTQDDVTVGLDGRPHYVAPKITSLTEDEVLDEVGPVQAYTGSLPFGF